MDARGVELIAEVRTPGAGAELVIGPEHDVVGEELRAPVEQLGERPLPVLGVELVLLLHRDPGKLTSLLGHPLVELGVLGLELRKFIASRLPFLAGSDLVRGHLSPPWAVRHLGVAARGSLVAARRASYVKTGVPGGTHRPFPASAGWDELRMWRERGRMTGPPPLHLGPGQVPPSP